MNNFTLKIALRYLKSKKTHNAVNIISIVAMCGVVVTTAAMVCVLSVFNGFSSLIGSKLAKLDPPIMVNAASGKAISNADSLVAAIASIDGVEMALPTISDHALAVYDGMQMPVLVKGVPDGYEHLTGINDVASNNNWKAWLYLAPVLILLVVFLLYPLVNTMFIAFTDNYKYATGEYDGFTINNFGVILGLTTTSTGATQTNFVQYAIPNTFILVFMTVPVSTLLALIISVALNSIKWFQKFLQTVFFMPYVTNGIAVGMVFAVIYDNQGVIN